MKQHNGNGGKKYNVIGDRTLTQFRNLTIFERQEILIDAWEKKGNARQVEYNYRVLGDAFLRFSECFPASTAEAIICFQRGRDPQREKESALKELVNNVEFELSPMCSHSWDDIRDRAPLNKALELVRNAVRDSIIVATFVSSMLAEAKAQEPIGGYPNLSGQGPLGNPARQGAQ